jgi:uncharacterized protein (DUF58 family)
MTDATPVTRFIDEGALRKLGRLRLIARHPRAGQMKGERRSTKRGTSIEFADYRDYRPGDDLRLVDWNVYARTDRPYVKLHEEEEDLAVHIVLDASASMQWPEDDPHANKFVFARRLAGLLGHLALGAGDRLTVTALRADGLRQFGPVRGPAQRLRLFNWLAALEPAGITDLNLALRHYAQSAGRPGLALVISDLFSPGGYRDGLTALRARGNELAVIHTLAPDELDPPIAGDLRLIDVETGTPQDVTLDAGLRDIYRRRVNEWQHEVAAFCRTRGAHYVGALTDAPPEETILRGMRRAGVVG